MRKRMMRRVHSSSKDDRRRQITPQSWTAFFRGRLCLGIQNEQRKVRERDTRPALTPFASISTSKDVLKLRVLEFCLYTHLFLQEHVIFFPDVLRAYFYSDLKLKLFLECSYFFFLTVDCFFFNI